MLLPAPPGPSIVMIRPSRLQASNLVSASMNILFSSMVPIVTLMYSPRPYAAEPPHQDFFLEEPLGQGFRIGSDLDKDEIRL